MPLIFFMPLALPFTTPLFFTLHFTIPLILHAFGLALPSAVTYHAFHHLCLAFHCAFNVVFHHLSKFFGICNYICKLKVLEVIL